MFAVALDRLASGPEQRRLWIRIGALAILYLILESLEWTWLHRSVRASLAFWLDWLNHGVRFGLSDLSSSYLYVDGSLFRITRGCTYINFALTVAPFVWRFGRHPARNFLWLLVWLVAMYTINIARLTFAAHFQVGDWTWSAAHDWPNLVLRWLIIVPVVWLALRADRSQSDDQRIARASSD
jgi:exosortase/archaeosortase family protein